MKQTVLTRWIEVAEARSICLLAEENPAQATVTAIYPTQSVHTIFAKLHAQLFLAEAAQRLTRFQRTAG